MFDDNVSVLVPYKEDGGYREKNWEWIKKRYETIMPNAEICIGYSNEELFSRAAAINNAAKNATRDIFMIADADLTFDIDPMKYAIEALNYYPWVIPYRSLFHLDSENTNELYRKDPSIILNNTDFPGCSKVDNINGWEFTGGFNLISRNNFEKVRGYDERFKGWGAEDDAFYWAVETVCGHFYRIETTMWHLYHPPQSKDNYSNNINLLREEYKDKETILGTLNNKSKI